mgnify:CR=1 FL=1
MIGFTNKIGPFVEVIEQHCPDYWDGLRAIWRRKPDRDSVSVEIRPNGLFGEYTDCLVRYDDSFTESHVQVRVSWPATLKEYLRWKLDP